MMARASRQPAVGRHVWSALAIALAAWSCGGGGETSGPTPLQFTVGGSVTGLTGGGLVLQLQSISEVSIAAGASTFTFPGRVNSGADYNVLVKSQPTNPSQTCTVGNQSGTARANISSVSVTCTTNSYIVSGTVSGLTGTGLTLALNGGNVQALAPGATAFAFPGVASGTSYTVTVATQPTPVVVGGVTTAPQACTVANGTGTVGATNVAGIAITCVAISYTVSGTVTGLTGSGLVLQNNGGNDVTLAAGVTSFSFSSPVTAGSSYRVTVKTQPSNPSQTCSVANATGPANANVLVAVSCVSNSLTVGGSVSGLTAAGLSLLLNGASTLTVASGATTFAFPSTVATGSSYAVTVATHPTGQTCAIAGGTGTVGTTGISSIAITCTNNSPNSWTVGGSISGLSASGLVLLLNGSTSLPVASGTTTFAFAALASGASYTVTVSSQPDNLTCAVSNGAGTVGSANIVGIAIICQAATYTVGGTITGYTGTGLRLVINGGISRTIAAGGTTFVFPALSAGAAYAVTVAAQPTSPTQTCTVANGTGTLTNANVTDIIVSCVNTFSVGGAINNQNANGLVLLLNGGSPLARAIDAGSFTFTGLPAGTPYAITVGTQPSAPAQTCSVTNGTGVIGTSNVTNVTVQCINGGPIIGGNIQGYTGTGLTLRINGGAPFTPQAKTRFSFPDFYNPGTEFNVSIASQPTAPAQSCTLIRGAGAILPAGQPNNVQNILVQCTTNNTTGLSGTYSTLVGGKRNYLTLWPDGTYTYASRTDDPACSGTNGNGVEYGVYNYNETTGAFAFLTGAVDTNGECGVWNSIATPQVGLSGTVVKTGTTLTLTTGSQTLTFTAVPSTPGGLYGSYQTAGATNGEFFVLQSDNTYLVVTTQANGQASNGHIVGYERGCFTSTASTIQFSLSTTCRPDGASTLDLNGTAGLSNGGLGVPIPYVLTGANTLTLDGDSFLVRIVPN